MNFSNSIATGSLGSDIESLKLIDTLMKLVNIFIRPLIQQIVTLHRAPRKLEFTEHMNLGQANIFLFAESCFICFSSPLYYICKTWLFLKLRVLLFGALPFVEVGEQQCRKRKSYKACHSNPPCPNP